MPIDYEAERRRLEGGIAGSYSDADRQRLQSAFDDYEASIRADVERSNAIRNQQALLQEEKQALERLRQSGAIPGNSAPGASSNQPAPPSATDAGQQRGAGSIAGEIAKRLLPGANLLYILLQIPNAIEVAQDFVEYSGEVARINDQMNAGIPLSQSDVNLIIRTHSQFPDLRDRILAKDAENRENYVPPDAADPGLDKIPGLFRDVFPQGGGSQTTAPGRPPTPGPGGTPGPGPGPGPAPGPGPGPGPAPGPGGSATPGPAPIPGPGNSPNGRRLPGPGPAPGGRLPGGVTPPTPGPGGTFPGGTPGPAPGPAPGPGPGGGRRNDGGGKYAPPPVPPIAYNLRFSRFRSATASQGSVSSVTSSKLRVSNLGQFIETRVFDDFDSVFENGVEIRYPTYLVTFSYVWVDEAGDRQVQFIQSFSTPTRRFGPGGKVIFVETTGSVDYFSIEPIYPGNLQPGPAAPPGTEPGTDPNPQPRPDTRPDPTRKTPPLPGPGTAPNPNPGPGSLPGTSPGPNPNPGPTPRPGPGGTPRPGPNPSGVGALSPFGFIPPVVPTPGPGGRTTPNTGPGPGSTPAPQKTPDPTATPPSTDTKQPTVCRYDSLSISRDVKTANTKLEEQKAILELIQTTFLVDIRNTSARIDNKLGPALPGNGISGFLKQLWDRFNISKVLELLTFITVLHNAFMLSNALTQTLFSAFDNVLEIFDVDLKDSEGRDINTNEWVGDQIESFFKSIFGAESVDGFVEGWKKYNRIYQAAANIIFSIQSISYSILEAVEVVGNYVAKIGNAAKKAGTVLENAYGWMNPNLNFMNGRFFRWMNGTQEVVENIDQVTSEVLNITETTQEIKRQSAELSKELGLGEEAQTRKEEAAKTAAQPPNINIEDERRSD